MPQDNRSKKHRVSAPALGSSASSRARVSELASHITALDAEVGHLRKAARREFEERWALHHTDLFPRFLAWKDSLGLEPFAVYSYGDKLLRAEPLLSSPRAPLQNAPQDPRADRVSLDAEWNGPVGDLVAFALASRELQVDFRSGVLCVPIVFFENVTGVVLARMQGAAPSAYARILAETGALLASVREACLEGNNAVRSARSAS